MTLDLAMLLFVLSGALVLFYTQWIRTDMTAIAVLLAMLLPWRPEGGRLHAFLSPQEAFSGFGSTAIMMVIAMFVVSAGLVRTGAAELVGRRLFGHFAGNELTLQAAVLTSVSLFSAFLNDTTAVLVWMPVVISFCNERGLSPRRYLLAVAYGSLLGGQWTLIGTRSNLIVSDYLHSQTGTGLGFFEFTPIALTIFVASLAFYVFLGVRMLPPGQPESSLAEAYHVTDFLTEVLVTPSASILGSPLSDLKLKERRGVEVLEIIRNGQSVRAQPWQRLAADDVLIVQGASGHIARLLEGADYTLRKELEIDQQTLRSVDLRLVEVLIARNSAFVGQTPTEIDLLTDYGLSVMGVAREGRSHGERPTSEPLRFGDSLLLCGHPESVEQIKRGRDLLLVNSDPFPLLRPGRALVMAAILVGAVVTAALKLLPTATALTFAAAATVATGCLRPRDLYNVIDWTAIAVVGGMMPFGLALEKSGSTELIAHSFHNSLGSLGTLPLTAVLLLGAMCLAQLIEKTAVAIILAPLYFDIAQRLALAPQPLLLGLALILSAAFMTPVAHEATILVMGPGRYKFRDYIRVGGGLAAVNWLVTTAMVTAMYHYM